MTDTPDQPPPVTLPPVTVPPGTPAGRPRIWQVAVLFVAFGIVAGGSCAAFLGEVTGRGRGGRNQELALSVVAGLDALREPAAFLSVGTDGIDGPTDAAGGLVDGTTLERARGLGVDLDASLADNDAYHALDRLGDLVRTGPTDTNVGDLQVLAVGVG